LPHIDEVGKHWDSDAETPFCSVGDPGRLWVVVPLGPAEYRLLQEDLEEAHRHGADLPVSVRVPGRPGRTWQGRAAPLPESEAAEVPMALTQRGGGPVPVKPGEQPNVYVPQSQQYLVAVALVEPDGAICPGSLARVLIRCRWRTGAWWLARVIASTFDL